MFRSSLTVPERTALLALALTHGIGKQILGRLLEKFGSPFEILAAAPIALQTVRGVGPHIATEIHAIDDNRLRQLERDLIRWQATGINLILWGDSDYPAALAELIDSPPAIFTRGTGLLDSRPARECRRIALVGTRQPTPESITLATDLARIFAAQGWTVVSGLARGIDSAAHDGALTAGGRTLAVLGSGIAQQTVYPPENSQMAVRIAARGMLLCECPPDSAPSPKYLALRNRLITGLSRAVIIIEAGPTSGALHAARHAQRQGRLLFVVPNNSEGNQALIAKGALPVREVADVLQALA